MIHNLLAVCYLLLSLSIILREQVGAFAVAEEDERRSADKRRPNILLITADDMGFDSVGSYGCPVEKTTPNIDRLAKEGFQFHYGFINIAVCTPSRHVILTGSHTHQTKTRGFTEVEKLGPALPDVLRQNGYYTAQVNKQQRVYEWDRDIKETDWGRNVTFHGELAGSLVEEAGEKPWFIVYNLNDPHRPFHGSAEEKRKFEPILSHFTQPSRVYGADEIDVPGFLPDLPDVRKEMAQYYSSVRRADDGVGALLRTLEASGLTNSTVVVFLSDNGISNPYAKINCYQASLRVPFILRFPGFIAEGTSDKINMVSAVDLAPTLLELAGLEVPGYMAGRSFVSLLEGKEQDRRNYVIGYYYRNVDDIKLYPEFAVHMRDWVYIYNPWVDGKTEVRNSDYANGLTMIAMRNASKTIPSVKERLDFHRFRIREELYNVRQDPNSYINVASEVENRGQVVLMRQLLVEWMEETDHPAFELMQDPHNENSIAAYMAFEECTAVQQNQEKETKTKSNITCHLSSSSSTGDCWSILLVLSFLACFL